VALMQAFNLLPSGSTPRRPSNKKGNDMFELVMGFLFVIGVACVAVLICFGSYMSK